MKMVKTNQLKTVIFTPLKNPCMLHGRVFVMFKMSLVEKTCIRGFPTRTDINRAVQPPKMILDLHLGSRGNELSTYVAKTKVLISCAVTAQLLSHMFLVSIRIVSALLF